MQTFIKQYGEKRTGTNYLRALLTTACPQVQVLMHILGDKHEAPPRALFAGDAASPWELTIRHAAATTRADDSRQQVFTEELSTALAEALQRREVYYCISVKNPYAWAFSMMKQHGCADSRDVKPQRLSLFQTILTAACEEFNRKYAAWYRLREDMPEQTMIVRYEHLLACPRETVANICGKMHLPFLPESMQSPEKIVLPAHWDHHPPETHHETFDGGFYRSGKYLSLLHPALIAVVDQHTDWELMSAYGYKNVSTFQL